MTAQQVLDRYQTHTPPDYAPPPTEPPPKPADAAQSVLPPSVLDRYQGAE